MSTPILRRTKGNGINLQIAVREGAGKSILCLHGLTANSRCWDLVASRIAPRHRVIAVDLRGRGLSDHPPTGYSLDHHCRDVLALLDDLQLDRPVLMGHSLGAFISLAFAANYPNRVDRLILIDGGGKLSDEQMQKVLAGIKPSLDRLGQVFPSFEAYVSLLKQTPFLQPWSPYLDAYFRYEVEEVEGGIRSRVQPGYIAEELLNLKQTDASQFYEKVACSTLILRATKGMLQENDLLLPEDVAERMLRAIPHARQVNVEGTNHYSILFHPNEKRDQAIIQFLEEK